MTPNDLNILIQEGEGTTLEFKENLSSSFARELVALANTIGGKILLGVRDDGTVVGVHDSNALRARIQDIARNCDPPVKVLTEPVGGVLAVHRIGFIEKAGTGIRRIRNETRAQGCPEPEFEANGFVTVTFRPNPEVRAEAKERPMGRVTTEVTGEVTTEVTGEVRLLQAISGEMTRQGLRDALGLRNDEHFRKAYLLPALQAGLIEMTIPDKPHSSNQRYRLTPAGREFLRQTEEKQ